ncbi:MAG TPA: hypothetical protein VFK81_04825 [Terriglobales bacterium]|nr:hypothetical protein [Terriglobales bacterium]
MAWENIDVTRSGELAAGVPLPPLSAANLLNQRVADSGGRQNLGSKEFKNKIFETRNLAAGRAAASIPVYLLRISSIAIRNHIL